MIAAMTLSSFAAFDTALLYHDGFLTPTVVSDGTNVVGAVVDTQKYKGFGEIVFSISAPAAAATNFTGVVQLQSSATSGGSYANVPGKSFAVSGTNAVVQPIPYEFGSGNRYLKAVVALTNDSAIVSATIHSFK